MAGIVPAVTGDAVDIVNTAVSGFGDQLLSIAPGAIAVAVSVALLLAGWRLFRRFVH